MTLSELNANDRANFVRALGWIFEDSPWVAERAWEKRPFETLDALHDAMTAVVASASVEEQIALLRAHPDLGAVGSQANPQMSDASIREQQGAGLDAVAGDEIKRLEMLNAAYHRMFGFPFLYAVRGSTIRDILGAIERRSLSDREVERQEALRQVYRIARFRLEEIIQ